MSTMGIWWDEMYGPSDSYLPHSEEEIKALREIAEQERRYKAERPAKEAREKAAREREAALKAEKFNRCLVEAASAKAYPVKIESTGDTFECPVLYTQGARGTKTWAIVGDKCFPVVYQLGTNAYWLDEDAMQIPLKDILEGMHATRGYSFQK